MDRQTFVVHMLEDKEFDNLPYQNISDSLGIADPESGNCFVRKTGVKEFDMATAQHEINHLIESGKAHLDENNIYHKKIFKEVLLPILAPIAGALLGGPIGGSLLSGLGTTMGPAVGAALGGAGGSAIQQAATTGKVQALPTILGAVGGGFTGAGAAPGILASKAGQGGYLGQVLSGAQSAIGMTPGVASKLGASVGPGGSTMIGQVPSELVGTASSLAKTPVSQISNITKGIASAVPSVLGTAMGALQGPVTASQAAQGYSNLSQVPQLGNTGNVALNAGSQITKQGAGSLIEKAKELATPQNILGAGLSLASAAPKTPTFEFPSSVNELRNKLTTGQGLTSLGEQARGELGNILKSTPQELYPTANDAYYDATLRRTRENYAEAQKQLDAAYNLAGLYGSGEHLAQKSKLQEELARTESAVASETEQRRFELARTDKLQAIQQALGVDENTMNDLVGLSGLDVQTAAMMYGASVQDVQAIREALGTLGSELLIRGTQQPTIQQ